MTLCTALRKMSLVFSSRKQRQPMIYMALPCNPVLESCCFLCMFRFLAVQFGPVFGLQLHQFTAMVILYGLDFILQPFDGFLVRGNLTAQILYFIFQGFRFSGSPADSGVQKLASFFLVQSGAFLADSPVKVFTLPFLFICFFDKGVGNIFRFLHLFVCHFQLMFPVLSRGIKPLHFLLSTSG